MERSLLKANRLVMSEREKVPVVNQLSRCLSSHTVDNCKCGLIAFRVSSQRGCFKFSFSQFNQVWPRPAAIFCNFRAHLRTQFSGLLFDRNLFLLVFSECSLERGLILFQLLLPLPLLCPLFLWRHLLLSFREINAFDFLTPGGRANTRSCWP